ncbi:holo-ACP synthase [Persephonella sp.]
MKIFTGIDIVENSRIEKAINRFGDLFLRRVFTDREIAYCLDKKDSVACFSGRFAGKEAFIKAYYQAFRKKIRLKDIEIIGKQGMPAEILLHHQITENESMETIENISLSISHEKKYSVAVVIITL